MGNVVAAGVLFLLIPLLLFVIGWRFWDGLNGPVERRRVEKFAERQDLVITPENGGLVIGYLARIRRWRAIGLAVGVWAAITGGFLSTDGYEAPVVVGAFAGWLCGAVGAELVASHSPAGARRRAELDRRGITDYIPAHHIAYTGIVGCFAVATYFLSTTWTLGSGLPFAEGFLLPVLGLVLWATALHRILRRPSLAETSDQVAADHAVRGYSLKVINSLTFALMCLEWSANVDVGFIMLAGLLGAWLMFKHGRTVSQPESERVAA
ncbi:hypothetical protein [Salininema proteolyticum]|uniref:Uncharacterized protein n=1 Tax=Salininema proteolyticum TaxID=1607685 RepID=A0ABV8TWE7_9ACTN